MADRDFEKRLGAAIEKAAEKLPEQWEIVLSIERHSGTAALYGPDTDGHVCGGEYDGEDLADTIENAIAYAISEQSTATTEPPE